MAATQEFKRQERDFVRDMFGIEQCPGTLRIPEAHSGRWRVQDTIDIENEYIYQQLFYDEKIIMDNHPKHLSRYNPILQNAHGNVLINGLGLGVSLFEILKREEVISVNVIESSRDVIRLVSPSFDDPRVNMICADAFEYPLRPNEYYQIVWHAIWAKRSDVREEEKTRLYKKYQQHCDWQKFLFDEVDVTC